MVKCPHTESGEPYGYPTYPCAWPGCPRGVEAPRWVLAGPSHDSLKPWLRRDREFERERSVTPDGTLYFSWKEIK